MNLKSHWKTVQQEEGGNIHPTEIDKDGVYVVNGAGSPSQKGIKTLDDFARVHAGDEREFAVIVDKDKQVKYYAKGYKNCVYFDEESYNILKETGEELEFCHNHPSSNGWSTFSPLSDADIQNSIYRDLPTSAVSHINGKDRIVKFELNDSYSHDTRRFAYRVIKRDFREQRNLYDRAITKEQAKFKDHRIELNTPYIKKFNREFKGKAYAKLNPESGNVWYFETNKHPIFSWELENARPTDELYKNIAKFQEKYKPNDGVVGDISQSYVEVQKEILDKSIGGMYKMKGGEYGSI